MLDVLTRADVPAEVGVQAVPADRPSRAEAEAAVRTLIRWAGDNPGREGLHDTPARVVRAYEEWFGGYARDPAQILGRRFEHVSQGRIGTREVLVGVGEHVQGDDAITVAQPHFKASPVAIWNVLLAPFFIDAKRLSVLQLSDVHGSSLRAVFVPGALYIQLRVSPTIDECALVVEGHGVVYRVFTLQKIDSQVNA